MIIESINLFDFERMSFDNKVKEHYSLKGYISYSSGFDVGNKIKHNKIIEEEIINPIKNDLKNFKYL